MQKLCKVIYTESMYSNLYRSYVQLSLVMYCKMYSTHDAQLHISICHVYTMRITFN